MILLLHGRNFVIRPSLTIVSSLFSSKMKDVIDVLAMQREKRNTLQKSITIDYSKSNDSFTVSRFIFECGMSFVVTSVVLICFS